MPWRPARDGGIVGKPAHPGLREITVRSMMGEFGGNAGLLSLWFDDHAWEWRFDFAVCALGQQHLWWAVHILDLVTILARPDLLCRAVRRPRRHRPTTCCRCWSC